MNENIGSYYKFNNENENEREHFPIAECLQTTSFWGPAKCFRNFLSPIYFHTIYNKYTTYLALGNNRHGASLFLTHSLIKGLSYHNQSSFWLGSKVTGFRDGTRSGGQDSLHRLKLTKEEEEDIVITKVSKPESKNAL